MSQYIERLNDGTVRVVKYNRCHAGPVSERLTLTRKIKWLSHWCQEHPADDRAKKRLRDTNRRLTLLLSATVNSPQKLNPKNTPRPTREPQRPYPPLVTHEANSVGAPLRGIAPPRDNTEAPRNLHPHPDKTTQIQASAT